MAWRTGDRVLQPLYGLGDVIDVDADRVTIAFDDGQVRKFVISIVDLMPSDAPKPARPPSSTRSRRAGKSAVKGQTS